MTRTPARVVVEALACVAREAPQAHARMCAALGARTLALAIGGEVVHLALDDAAVGPPAIRMSASPAALRDIVLGDVELVDALGDGRVDVIGDAADLIAASDAMMWFLQGAVRCLSIEPLADELFAQRGET